MKLFRPTGVRELELIAESGWRAFPRRLPHQPIFYPVLTFEYAAAIAKNWNTKDDNSGHAGFVLSFKLEDEFACRYPVQTAGSREDQELWVPAEKLSEFNQHIRGTIACEAAYYGENFAGEIDALTGLPVAISQKSTHTVVVDTDAQFNRVFKETANIATFESERDEQEYERRDAVLIEAIKAACADVLGPKLSDSVHHLEDWWPNHTRYIDCNQSVFSAPLVQSLRSLLNGDYRSYRIQIVVYRDMMEGETMLGSLVLYREWALADRALYDEFAFLQLSH
jgi:hypothetical protein